ncbi:MAG: hypothetical protein BWX64_00306 [Acidobacteria bacterium ADurb.Bin051]|nr:MAG: hypothetical protein BWX64_00306 [Acidobacteria bacterium ADurb.Bin051]
MRSSPRRRRSPAAPNAAAGAVRAVQSRKLEGALRFQLDAARLSDGLEEQCRFHPSRRWRFDFAWPLERLAVEVQGGVWIAGRHSGGRGQIADCEKLAAAVLEGWRVLYVTSPHIRSGVALNWIARARGRELEQAAGRRRATL